MRTSDFQRGCALATSTVGRSQLKSGLQSSPQTFKARTWLLVVGDGWKATQAVDWKAKGLRYDHCIHSRSVKKKIVNRQTKSRYRRLGLLILVL